MQMMRRSLVWLLVVSVLLAYVAACGGGSDPGEDPDPPEVSVSVDPATVTLDAGGTVEFSATVAGTSASSVSWDASCGRLSGSGTAVTYTAPASVRSCSVTATSVEDTTRSASAAVTVLVGADTEAVSSPDEDASLRDPSGDVEITLPAGAVPEAANVRIGVGHGDDAPDEAKSIEAVIDVSGIGHLAVPVEVRFRLPSDRDAASEYAVFRRSSDGGPWSELPSWVEGDQVVAMTGSFSTLGLFGIGTRSKPEAYTISASVRNEAGREFDRLTYGTHFGNNAHDVGDIAREFNERIDGLCYGAALVTADYFAANRSAPIARNFSGDDLRIQNMKFGELLVRRQNEQPFWRSVAEKAETLLEPAKRAQQIASGAETAFQLIQDGELALLGLWASPTLLPPRRFQGHAVLAYDVVKTYDADRDELIYSFYTYDVNATSVTYSDSLRITQYNSTVWVRIRNYHAYRVLPLTGRVDWHYDSGPLAAGFDPATFFAYPADRLTGALPWTNPVLDGVAAAVDGQRLQVTPSMTHPDAGHGATITGILVRVFGSGGEVVYSSGGDLTGATYEVEYDLQPGEYTAWVMVQDDQENWSNREDVTFTVEGVAATRIVGYRPITPPGTRFRPGRPLPLEMEVEVVTDLPRVEVTVWLVHGDGNDALASSNVGFITAPGGSVRLPYGIWMVTDTREHTYERAAIRVFGSDDRDTMVARQVVAVDYVLAPQEVDLWLGNWSGGVRQTVHPDFTTSFYAWLREVQGDNPISTVAIRTASDDGSTDFVAHGQLAIGTVSATAMRGHLTCHEVTGSLFGRPVTSCADIFSWSTSGFSATRTSNAHATVTVDDLAAEDPVFADMQLTKAGVAVSTSAISDDEGAVIVIDSPYEEETR